MEAMLKQDISLLEILDIRMYNGSQQLRILPQHFCGFMIYLLSIAFPKK